MAVAPPELVIRAKVASDEAFVAELAGAAFAEYSQGSEGAAEYTVRATRKDDARTWIAVLDESPVGFVVLVLMPPTANIEAIAVVSAERGRGIGYRLLQTAERYAAQSRASSLSAFTAEANVAALDLFFRRGFAIRRRLPRFYRGVENACALEKSLLSVK